MMNERPEGRERTSTVQPQLPLRGANVPLASLPPGTVREPIDLVAQDGVRSSGIYYSKDSTTPRAAVHLMHPRTDQTRNYNIAPLLDAGYAVLGRAGRSVNNDVDTVQEECLLDVAAGIEFLHARGHERVVLLGNSGGGPLASYYQSQATCEPSRRVAVDPLISTADLTTANLPPADAVVLIGAHMGQGTTLLKMIDPSVVDEHDAFSIDPVLDMYDPRNGFVLPVGSTRYSQSFVESYRAAQLNRVHKIDGIARGLLARKQDANALRESVALGAGDRLRLGLERVAHSSMYLTVYRTTADLAYVDPSIDPDDRLPGGHDGGSRPDLQNWAQIGFAHYLTPRAWLSSWSALSSRSKTADALATVSEPTLIVHYGGDIYTRVAEAESLCATSAASDCTFVLIRHADHYGQSLVKGAAGGRLEAGTQAVVSWMRERF